MPNYGSTIADLEPGRPAYRIVAPKKLALGKSVNGSKSPGLFRVYVPTRDGGELELKTTGGEIRVYGPDGQPARDADGNPVAAGSTVKFEVPFDVFGWFGIVVTGSTSYQLSSKFTIRGKAKDADGTDLVPWHFYYFAFTRVVDWGTNHPSAKYQRRFGGQANDWEKTSFWISEKTRGISGYDGHGITAEACNEKNARSGTNYTVENCGWWGHCDAAATAAAIFKKVPAASGFDPIDLQWMLTEIAMRHAVPQLRCEFHLGGENQAYPRSAPSNQEEAKPEGGQNVDRDAGRFHAALVRVIKRRAEPALMDFRALQKWGGPDEVWNQLCYKFESEVVEAEDDRAGADEEALARRVSVKTRLTANADNENLAKNNGDPESDGQGWIRDCEYTISFDKNGNVDIANPSNNYTYVGWGKDAPGYPPRYIFTIKAPNFGTAAGGNPHVSWDKVRALGVEMRKRYGG
jgi:hypothetical protein